MEMLHADEYIACIKAGMKPKLALVGRLSVTDGMLTENGKYFLMIDGSLYEVNPDLVLYAQWEGETGSQPVDADETITD